MNKEAFLEKYPTEHYKKTMGSLLTKIAMSNEDSGFFTLSEEEYNFLKDLNLIVDDPEYDSILKEYFENNEIEFFSGCPIEENVKKINKFKEKYENKKDDEDIEL